MRRIKVEAENYANGVVAKEEATFEDQGLPGMSGDAPTPTENGNGAEHAEEEQGDQDEDEDSDDVCISRVMHRVSTNYFMHRMSSSSWNLQLGLLTFGTSHYHPESSRFMYLAM